MPRRAACLSEGVSPFARQENDFRVLTGRVANQIRREMLPIAAAALAVRTAERAPEGPREKGAALIVAACPSIPSQVINVLAQPTFVQFGMSKVALFGQSISPASKASPLGKVASSKTRTLDEGKNWI